MAARVQGMGRRGLATLAAACLVLAGCEVTEPVAPPPPPPATLPAPVAPPPIVPVRSAQSEALAQHYQRLQAQLLAQGLLRGDGGGPDSPFTDQMLARNFINIALYDEYLPGTGAQTPVPTISRLSRWDGPIRMQVIHGDSVPAAQRSRDDASIASYAARLSRLTGVAISKPTVAPNFHVLVLNEDDRLGFEDDLRALVPGIAESSVRAVMTMPRATLCLAIAFSDGDQPGYTRAIAVIRGEHPDLMRLACIHEELAQAMGLANDSPAARPSIFNDDEEFGLLTSHDELLLRMLYDPRFRTGMSAAEAAPIARQIAAELLAAQS